MKNEQRRDWVQILGQFGVIASLVFVGVQLKQDREIAIAQTFQARTAVTVENLTSDTQNTEMMEAYIRNQWGLEPHEPRVIVNGKSSNLYPPLTNLEYLYWQRVSLAWWLIYDNSYYQYQAGFLPENHWSRIRETIRRNLSTPNSIMREVYETLNHVHRPEFKAVVNEIITDIDAESNN